jgi:predicted RNA-binding Zn-ribbon protein involved in translation (DUF1610 family)
MRFLDLTFDCPVCAAEIVANEPGARKTNCTVSAVLTKDIGPYDAFAYYRGSLLCPRCGARIGLHFRDAIRRYAPRTELQGVRILDPDEGIFEEG